MLDLESNGAIFGPPFLPQNHQLQSGSSNRIATQPDLQRQTSGGGGEDCGFLHVPYVDYRDDKHILAHNCYYIQGRANGMSHLFENSQNC